MMTNKGFHFSGKRWFQCEVCGDAHQFREMHLYVTGNKEEPVLTVCPNCYQEYEDAMRAIEFHGTSMVDAVNQFLDVIKAVKEREENDSEFPS